MAVGPPASEQPTWTTVEVEVTIVASMGSSIPPEGEGMQLRPSPAARPGLSLGTRRPLTLYASAKSVPLACALAVPTDLVSRSRSLHRRWSSFSTCRPVSSCRATAAPSCRLPRARSFSINSISK